MGIFKSKDEKIVDHFTQSYSRCFALFYEHLQFNGKTDDAQGLREAHHQSIRRGAKDTLDRYGVLPYGVDAMSDSLLALSASRYGFDPSQVKSGHGSGRSGSQE